MSISQKALSIIPLLLVLASPFKEEAKDDEGVSIGIDLGTTYCVVSWYNPETQQTEVIVNKAGKSVIPSTLLYDAESDNFLVGEAAKYSDESGSHSNKFYDAKRLIGKTFAQYQKMEKLNWPFQIDKVDDRPYYKAFQTKAQVDKFGKKSFPAVQISSKLLKHLKEMAERKLERPVKSAVITVPAAFKESQRQDTVEAGNFAGLKVDRIINEPTAAALSYGFGKNDDEDDDVKNVFVYDLGGGTFDVTVLSISGKLIEIKASVGNPNLGGQDFDGKLMDAFFKRAGLDKTKLKKNELNMVKNAAEEVKKKLSNAHEAEFDLMLNNERKKVSFNRIEFEEMIKAYIEETLRHSKIALKKAGMGIKQINSVLLVGGSTNIPYVRKAIQKMFGKKPEESQNVDTVVAEGAAIQAAMINGDKSEKLEDMLLIDIVSMSIGIETAAKTVAVLVPQGSKLPYKSKQTFTTVSHDQTAVDIVVSVGYSKLARKRTELGRFHLSGISSGHPEIEIEIAVDQNNIVTCTAKEPKAGVEKVFKLEKTASITDKEREQIERDFEQNKDNEEIEVEIVEKKYDIQTRVNKLTPQAPEATKKQLAAVLAEANAVTEYTPEARDQILALHKKLLDLTQDHSAEKAKDHEEDEEDDEDEEL